MAAGLWISENFSNGIGYRSIYIRNINRRRHAERRNHAPARYTHRAQATPVTIWRRDVRAFLYCTEFIEWERFAFKLKDEDPADLDDANTLPQSDGVRFSLWICFVRK